MYDACVLAFLLSIKQGPQLKRANDQRSRLAAHRYAQNVVGGMCPNQENSELAILSVFGLGRVGLTTAVCLAKKGHDVLGIELDAGRVETIQQGDAPLFEPELDHYLRDVIATRSLTVTTEPRENSKSEISFITVGTPSNPDGSFDLEQIQSVAASIGRSLRDRHEYQLVVVKSTVTPGTSRNVIKPALEKESGKKCGMAFGLCSNPEFLREGQAIHDTQNPDRIIIGSEDERCASTLENFYRELYKSNIPSVIKTTYENAELIKYANNAFLATKISFINTIARIAERIPHADVTTVANGIGLDARICPSFLEAGLGYGGSCLPKDVAALAAFSRSIGYEAELLVGVSRVNRKQSSWPAEYAKRVSKSVKSRRLAILGLAFKPNTDDIREAVSISVVRSLLQEGAQVVVYDPRAMQNARHIFGEHIQYAPSARDCLEGAELAILVTEWEEFKQITPEDFLALMRRPVLLDGRRIYDPNAMRKAGIEFAAVGLASAR